MKKSLLYTTLVIPVSVAEESFSTSSYDFETGEIYLFHKFDRHCPAAGSLWGLFDRRFGSGIYLETSSRHLTGFSHWHRLSHSYRYCRRVTRAEVICFIHNFVRHQMSARGF